MDTVTRAQFRRAIHAGLRAAPSLGQDIRNALIRHAETASETVVRDFYIDGDGCHCPIAAVGQLSEATDSALAGGPLWQFIWAFDKAMETVLPWRVCPRKVLIEG
jgi:hypothetical protein